MLLAARSLHGLTAAALVSLAWAALTSRWEWALLSVLTLALAAAGRREGRDPGPISLVVAVPLPALPLLDLAGLGEDVLSPLAALAGIAVLYFACLSFAVLLSLRADLRADPPGLLAAALLASVAIAALSRLGAYYADLLLGTSLLPDNAALMWPLLLHLGGSALLAMSLACSRPALRLLKLPEAGM